VDIEVKVDSSSVEERLARVDSKVSNIEPLLDQIGSVLISHYQSIMEPGSKGGKDGRAYLWGGLKASVNVISLNDHMVSVSPTVSYAADVEAGRASPPIRSLKPNTPGYVEYAWNEGGAESAALKLINEYYNSLLE
jgi:hypothetical protein